MSRTSRILTACTLALGVGLASCSSADEHQATQERVGADGALQVYATTGYLADAIANIAPEAEVTTMVGPGGDPHTYQPSTKDIDKIQSSDVVFWNGLHLEAQMIKQLESLGERQLAVGDKLPNNLLLDWPETDAEGNPLHDPHVWNSPEAWSLVVGEVADKLAQVDPSKADEYHENAAKYQAEIADANEQAATMLANITGPRILITGHDAFNYFGKTYGLDVYATDFVSTEAKLSASELSDLADLIADNKVPTIFQDNQANPQAIKSLQEAVHTRGWDVAISDEELFADTLGPTAPTDTYIGAFLHNAEAVAAALGGK